MKVLIAHNRYQYAGGEDHVVNMEAAMLRRHGHTVEEALFDNEHIGNPLSQLNTAAQAFFSPSSFRKVDTLIQGFQPDILHVHNFMPTLSPAVYFAARRRQIPVVQTLHNYRLVCAKGTLYREGRPCERCLEQNSFLPGVASACYRGSRLGSAVVGGTMALHAGLGTWRTHIDRYIALTAFAASRLKHRVPEDRLRIKPNFVPDQGPGTGGERTALFVGRLSEEKGIRTLLAADRNGALALPVIILGDGPLRDEVAQTCARPGSRLLALGHQTSTQVRELMKRAAVLLVPSDCYEGFPVSVVEAFCAGLPVIASNLGSLPEIIVENQSGLLHRPSDPADLAVTLARFARLSPPQVLAMRAAARDRYLNHYTEAINHRQLTSIYAEAIATAASPNAQSTRQQSLRESTSWASTGKPVSPFGTFSISNAPSVSSHPASAQLPDHLQVRRSATFVDSGDAPHGRR